MTGDPPEDGGCTASPGGLIVQKYGGSSVADSAGILRAARRISQTRAAGHEVVAVVSAMGDTTDELLDLAVSISPHPRPSDLDVLLNIGELIPMSLLAIALADLGAASQTFTGSKAGLITDNVYGEARIVEVKPDRIRACLARGDVAIVAGFQGRTRKKKALTTLGRGGSDLTAVALAAALGAKVCEIYTDVDGVYTADPRVVPSARKIDILSSEEMLELAASGAKVLHLRSVEYARRFGIPIYVRSSFAQDPGTLVLPSMPCVDQSAAEASGRERAVVSGVVGVNSSAKITVVGTSDRPGATSKILRDLAASGLNVELIPPNAQTPACGCTDISFTVPAPEASAALAALDAARGDIGFHSLRHNQHLGTVSLSGRGVRSAPNVFRAFSRALAEAGVEMELISMSEVRIAVLTNAVDLDKAVHALRRAFGLATDRTAAPP
nr:aspartate kinase [Arthrobacter sp. H5]